MVSLTDCSLTLTVKGAGVSSTTASFMEERPATSSEEDDADKDDNEDVDDKDEDEVEELDDKDDEVVDKQGEEDNEGIDEEGSSGGGDDTLTLEVAAVRGRSSVVSAGWKT